MPDHLVRSLWVWPFILAGLFYRALAHVVNTDPDSPFWWIEVCLYALMLTGLLLRGGQGFGLDPGRRGAVLVFLALFWAFGMCYELGLTIDGTGVGGMHPQTRASFILAQGQYVLMALATLWMVRRWHLGFAGAFWIAAGTSMAEGLIFTGVLTATVLGPNWVWSPVLFAYYALAYASFTALPLLVLAPQSLWRPAQPGWRPQPLLLGVIGFGVGVVIALIWGLGWGPLATWAFALPPNPLD